MITTINDLDTYLTSLDTSDVVELQELSVKIKELRQLFKTNQITLLEFDDLLDDLLRIDKINSELFSLDIYNNILKAYNTFMLIKSYLPLL